MCEENRMLCCFWRGAATCCTSIWWYSNDTCRDLASVWNCKWLEPRKTSFLAQWLEEKWGYFICLQISLEPTQLSWPLMSRSQYHSCSPWGVPGRLASLELTDMEWSPISFWLISLTTIPGEDLISLQAVCSPCVCFFIFYFFFWGGVFLSTTTGFSLYVPNSRVHICSWSTCSHHVFLTFPWDTHTEKLL